MNPFDLTGPAFLGFYAVLIVVALVLQWGLRRLLESGPPPPLPLDDPYAIAWLRGGAPEAVRVAALSLVDRGFLDIVTVDNAPRLARREGTVWQAPRNPLERALFDIAANPATFQSLNSDGAVKTACEAYRAALRERRLVPDDNATMGRMLTTITIGTALVGAGFAKIEVAVARGHSNIAFLVMLMVLAVILLIIGASRRRTPIGDRALADLRQLFVGLKGRSTTLIPGAMTADAMLLAAVFGMAALPGTLHAPLQTYFRQSASGGGGDGGGDGGSSGCGGGGGCGGCGS
jgi:uncharacterized protein (TIGR04222 family)